MNRGLLAFRLGVYLVVAFGLVAEGFTSYAWLVMALSVIPAAPLPGFVGRRTEIGVAVSLTLEAVLWYLVGPSTALVILPLFSIGTAGLILSSRSSGLAFGYAAAIQGFHIGVRGLSPYLDLPLLAPNTTSKPWGDLLVEAAFVIVVGLGFRAIGSVLRSYQVDLATQTRNMIYLTEVVEDKDRFIESAAHAIRTPLTGMLGFSELLASEPVEAEIRGMLDVVAGEGRRLSHLVDNLLIGARMESGVIELALKPVDVETIARSAWAAVGGEGGLNVYGSGVAMADAGRLKHIFVNLFENGRSHGRVPLTLDIAVDAGMVVAVVIDSGSGIPVAQRESVFARYSAGGEPCNPKPLGMGLPVARALARAMGGDLVSVDPGNRFDLTLPAVVAAVPLSADLTTLSV